MPFFVVLGVPPDRRAQEHSITVEKAPYPTRAAAEARARAAAPDGAWQVVEAPDALTAVLQASGAPPPPQAGRG